MSEISPLTQKIIKDFFRAQKNDFLENERFSFFFPEKKLLFLFSLKKNDYNYTLSLRKHIVEKKVKKIFWKLIKDFQNNKKIATSGDFARIVSLWKKEDVDDNSKDEEVLRFILEKYFLLLVGLLREDSKNISLFDWTISLMSFEIAHFFSKPNKKDVISFFMFNRIKDVLDVEEDVDDVVKNSLIFSSVQKSLFGFNNNALTYFLFIYFNEDWKEVPLDTVFNFVKKIKKEKEKIDFVVSHHLSKKIIRFCNSFKIVFLNIENILKKGEDDCREIFFLPESVEKETLSFYKKSEEVVKNNFYKKIAFYSLFLFLFSSFIYLITTPFSLIEKNLLLFWLLSPSLIFSFFAITIPFPFRKNKKKVVLETIRAIYKRERKDLFVIKKRRKSFLFFAAISFYLLLFVFVSWMLLKFLLLLNASLNFFLLYLFILCLVAYLLVSIRRSTDILFATERKERFLDIIIDVFAFPLLLIEKIIKTSRIEKLSPVLFLKTISSSPFSSIKIFLSNTKESLRKQKEKIYQ